MKSDSLQLRGVVVLLAITLYVAEAGRGVCWGAEKTKTSADVAVVTDGGSDCDICGKACGTRDTCCKVCGGCDTCGKACDTCGDVCGGCGACGESTCGDNCESCDTCGDGCQECCPLWRVRADATFLHRSRPDPQILISCDCNPGLLNADQFDPGFATGWDIGVVRRRVFGCWGIEGLFWSIGDWSSSVGPLDAPNGAFVQYVNPFGSDDPSIVTAAYHSELRNFEINLRRELCPCTDLIFGFRYLDLSEELGFVQETTGVPSVFQHQIRAHNFMTGFQVGVDSQLWHRGRLTVDGVVKAGLYANQTGNDTAVLVDGVPGGATSATEHHAAFAGEMRLGAGYQVTKWLTVRGGYQLLWLDGVALATRQVAVSDPLLTGTATVDTHTSPFYHGAFVGLELRR